MRHVYAVYGSGGYAREVMPVLREWLAATEKNTNSEMVFIDDFFNDESLVNGIKVYSFDAFLSAYKNHKKYCSIAIADKDARKKLSDKCSENDVDLLGIRAANSVVMDEVTIGRGYILSPFVTITSNVKIGVCFHANLYSYVGHDCIIGDYVTFAPAVKCNGNVMIEDNVYIGTGAIIYPGTKDKPRIIGANAKIAAGAVVKKDVPPNATVIGNPAQVINKRAARPAEQ